MNKTGFLIIALLCTLNLGAQIVYDYDEPIGERPNYGMRMGAGLSTMMGGELVRPRPYFGYTAGIYYMPAISKKRLNLYTELAVRFKGSNFANTYNNSGDSAYNKLTMMYVEAPIGLAYRVKPKDSIKKFIIAGIQPGYALRSAMYTGEDGKPINWSVYNQVWPMLPLKRFDLAVWAGWHVEGKIIGFQAALKAGILNINDNFDIPGLRPRTDDPNAAEKPIRNISLELSLLF